MIDTCEMKHIWYSTIVYGQYAEIFNFLKYSIAADQMDTAHYRHPPIGTPL